MSDRKKNIESFLNNIITQEEWDNNKDKYIEMIETKYSNYLEDYRVIKNIEDYNNIMVGGYIRYVNSNDELKWGGILLKKVKTNDIDYMIICNSNKNVLKICFYKNTIFYKKHTTASDKTRKLFISYLDKNI